MATDRDIRDAEIARLEAIVAGDGRENERTWVELVVAVARLLERPPDVELLARIAQRVERRASLGLPAVECGGDPPTRYGCSCLDRALDESDGGKRAVLRLARSLHWSPPPRVRERAADEEKPEPVAAPAPRSARGPNVPRPPAKPEPRPRIVRRTRKWFDPPDGPTGFSEMKF